MSKPLLSIGMIFRDDIRCIERCLRALEPLRQAVPCELVMADTGSVDGSREIAEKYADVLFDFPWIDDFSAARNAVMDRCSGLWYFSVDTDEYLDEDITELTSFLRDKQSKKINICGVVVRNYRTYEMDGVFSDFYGARLLRMSTGLRYEGAIHERFPASEDSPLSGRLLKRTILRHDGYVHLGDDAGAPKRQRNIRLLRKELERDPDNLRLLMQFIESGADETDVQDQIRRAAMLVQEKRKGWQTFGPSIMRYAARASMMFNFSETEEWILWAEENFAESYFTRVDLAYCGLNYYCAIKKDFAESIRQGEMYFHGLADFKAGRGNMNDLIIGTLTQADFYQEQAAHVLLALAYSHEEQMPKALAMLEALDYTQLDEEQISQVCTALYRIHSGSLEDTAPVVEAIWNAVSMDASDSDEVNKQYALLIASGATLFDPEYREKEVGPRPAYTVFLPLAGKCGLGSGAAVLETEDEAQIRALLADVDDWSQFPAAALIHAMQCGVQFPLQDKALTLDEMENLTRRMASDYTGICQLVQNAAAQNPDTPQAWAWERSMALIAVRNCEWKDEEQGVALARAFAKIEKRYLSRCCTPDVLRKDAIFILPPLHRFGWYCGLAFEALDGGDIAGYVRLLREGLAACEGMKPMVEFLTDHTPQLQSPKPSGELLALAEQVRTLLAQYPADDPAVAALKQSPAYRKVAHLIEGPDLGVLGGLKQ